MKRRIWIIVGIIAVVAAIAGVVIYRGQQAMAEILEGLQTEEVQMGSLVATVGGTGTVRANQTAYLVWKTSGTVEDVLVGVGDEVEEGDVLASLVQTSMPQNVILAVAEVVAAQNDLEALYDAYNALAVARAAEAVSEAEQRLEDTEVFLNNTLNPPDQSYIDQAESSMILAREQLEQAQEDWEQNEHRRDDVIRATYQNRLATAQQNYDAAVRRYNNLIGAADDLDVDNAQRDLEVAIAALAQAREDYEEILAGPDPEDVAAAEARIVAAQAALDQSLIRAPFAGSVTVVEPLPGDQIQMGAAAFRLDDLSNLLVDVEISEVDINRIEIGQEATLTFDAVLDREYHGRVVEVSPVGNVVQGIVNFTVTVELDDADEAIRPGMTAGVNLVVSQLDNVMLVPNRAVRVFEGQRVVYVMTDMGLQMAEIELGASSDLYSEVAGGDLQLGDVIVLNPPAVFMTGNGPPPFVQGR